MNRLPRGAPVALQANNVRPYGKDITNRLVYVSVGNRLYICNNLYINIHYHTLTYGKLFIEQRTARLYQTTCKDKTKGQTIGLPFRKVIANL